KRITSHNSSVVREFIRWPTTRPRSIGNPPPDFNRELLGFSEPSRACLASATILSHVMALVTGPARASEHPRSERFRPPAQIPPEQALRLRLLAPPPRSRPVRDCFRLRRRV